MQNIYRQLNILPQRTRQAIQRKWSMALASATLALALMSAPAINVAHAAEITVDGNSCTLVDAITAASQMADELRLAEDLIRQLDAILLSRSPG